MTTFAFRVITDEPQGFCIGFDPGTKNQDRWEVAEDIGDVPFIGNDGRLFLLTKEHVKVPEGTDMLIWRTPEEFAKWAEDNI